MIMIECGFAVINIRIASTSCYNSLQDERTKFFINGPRNTIEVARFTAATLCFFAIAPAWTLSAISVAIAKGVVFK